MKWAKVTGLSVNWLRFRSVSILQCNRKTFSSVSYLETMKQTNSLRFANEWEKQRRYIRTRVNSILNLSSGYKSHWPHFPEGNYDVIITVVIMWSLIGYKVCNQGRNEPFKYGGVISLKMPIHMKIWPII